MLYVTMILTSNEWSKIKSAAAEYWPSNPLDTQMSRQEASRRLLLSGIDQLRQAAAVEREARVNSYAQSLQPSANENAVRLPGDPRSRSSTRSGPADE
jgi:hypothetical protein